MGRFQALVKQNSESPQAFVELPGFNLFKQFAGVKPYAWFLPKPSAGVPEFLRVYEEFANRPLGLVDEPGLVASKVYPRTGEDRKLFTQFKAADQWHSVGLLLAACAQNLGGEVETLTPTTVRMRLGPGIIEVTPEGCWSHGRRMIFPAEGVPFKLEEPVTTIPKLVTYNPVLRALAELVGDIDESLLYAVTVAAHGLKEGKIGKTYLNKLARLEGALVAKLSRTERNEEKGSAALNKCLEVLESGSMDMIGELHEAAVPDLLSSRQFQRFFGDAAKSGAGRVVKAKTIEQWRDKLQKQFEDLSSAVG